MGRAPGMLIRAGFAAAVALAAGAASANAAVSYPASTGADGACEFTQAGVHTIQTDTGTLTRPDATTQPIGVDGGNFRVLNCTTITVASATTLLFFGQRAPDVRATGAVSIAGLVDVSATGTTPGAGRASSEDSGAGANGLGPSPGTGSVGGGGGGVFGGGGGGGGVAGGGGGGGGTTGHLGGAGGGPVGGPGGGVSSGGSAGGGGGAQSGEDAPAGSGGGGGGGAYGGQGPFRAGSGGGGGGGRSTTGSGGANGGGGGGALRIISPVSITISGGGVVRATGAGGLVGGSSSGTGGGSGGGGSGGGLQFIAPAITLDPGTQLSAVGGVGGAGAMGGIFAAGGAGGPGRIDISANTLSTMGAAIAPASTNILYSATLSLARAGSGTGSITASEPGLSCGSDCAEEYPAGTTVTLTASPDPGSKFSGWSGACAGTGPCTLALDASKSAAASFDAIAAPPAPIAPATPSPLETQIIKAKAKASGTAKVMFSGSGGVGPLSFECKLDKRSFKPCSSPRRYKGLDPGKHKVRVRAKDSTGAVDSTPAKAKLRVPKT